MCWKCGKDQDFSQSVYRSSVCPACGADLHSCRGCAFYAPGNHFDCRESVDEIVVEKECANFCGHFRAGKNARWAGAQGLKPDSNEGAKIAAAKLFGGPPENAAQGQSKADKARDAFNSLFG